MGNEVNDDPQQVLTILNSLGVVNVTALELKAFMRELKLYRKVKEKECIQWKEKVKAKILQNQGCLENQQLNAYSPSIVENTVTVHKQELRTRKIKKTQKHSEVLVNNTQHNDCNKENSIEESFSTIAVTFNYSNKNTSHCEKPSKVIQEESEIAEIPTDAPGSTREEAGKPLRRTKSAASSGSKRIGSTESRPASKSCNIFYICIF